MSYFDKTMTREEAWTKLYSLADEKTKDEMKDVIREYKEVLPVIIDKELSGPPMLTSYNV